MGTEKVVQLYKSEVYDQIELFLDKKQMRSGSDQTRESYKCDIKDFFKYKTKGNKSIEYLSNEDVQLIDEDEIVNYQLYLKNERNLSNKSINRKISTIRQFYGRLFLKKIVSNLSPFEEADRLKEGKNYHGVLTVDEVWNMANYIKVKAGLRKRLTKYYLILFAMDTCLRKQAILNLEWSDFIIKPNCTEVEIKAIDKGNEERRLKISKEFYDAMLQMKKENDSNKVFQISIDSIQAMMDDLRKHFNIDPRRNIVFHSFRKTGVTFQFDKTLDIMQAKKAAGHSSLNNTQIYIGERDYGNLGAVSSQIDLQDDELYKKVTHEELIKGIESLNKNQILLLNLKLNEITNRE